MKILADRERYEALQAGLVERITAAVRGHIRLLLDGRVPADLNEVTREIVFSVTSIFDACDDEAEHSAVPMLTFATNEARNELLIAAVGESSWMHEYASGGE